MCVLSVLVCAHTVSVCKCVLVSVQVSARICAHAVYMRMCVSMCGQQVHECVCLAVCAH